MKKYLVKANIKQALSYVIAFGFMVVLGYFFDGKKFTSDNFVFASIMTVIIIVMHISPDIKHSRKLKKAEKKKTNQNKKADA